ncbi:DUF1109 domain-containing protein [Sphingomonas oryzagri]|uniref:DUF1109 domain-containing protein n=1 Tax=Sphingomonas oryzagri TaxID=3042314 RepID=A0ABT6MZ49_9SPHN|nr:DUF1109 domain-containing protein [Sphingomonas oryzagri]MDH7638340.1 DUF1109 domain-containing protein [Sphingomonas oryzagri]
MSNDALILDLAADLAPVRRRSALRDSVWLLVLAAIETLLVLAAGLMRPDMGRMILEPFMMWKIGSLALLAGFSCAVAMRSFAPPFLPRRGLRGALGLAGLLMIGGLLLVSSADAGRPLLDRLSPAHGIMCSAAIIVLSLPMMAAVAVLMRRAAPVRPGESALAAGFAAATCGALVFTICCPMNDPLYVVVWYSLGVAVVTAMARWLLPRRFRL